MLEELPKIGDLILLDWGFCRKEMWISKRILKLDIVYLSPIGEWFYLSNLRSRKAEVIGKYTKVFGPFGYKTYLGE